MIALIKGVVEEKQQRYLVALTVSGLGYKVGVSPDLLSKTKVGQEVKLFIHSHVKEDAFDLYGFETKAELNLFELLISVSGVGPKTAMLVMSSGSVNEIMAAIAKGDAGFFTNTSGIGTKGSQRIIVDLRSKVGALGELDLSEGYSERINKERERIICELEADGCTFKEADEKTAERYDEFVSSLDRSLDSE